ncbi:MAG: helix-turn-helix domain-containing protein, partial [Candidatus Hadarchaeales archaeon]
MESSEELLNCIFGNSAKGRILSFMLKTGGGHSRADLMAVVGVCPRTLESCLRKLKAYGILVEED